MTKANKNRRLASTFSKIKGKLLPLKLGRNFSGINSTEVDLEPPDTMGAASPNYLVTFINGGFAVYDKKGKRLKFQTRFQFWKSLGTKRGQPASDPFDPKVLYDPFTRRFVVVQVSGTRSKESPGSWLLIAISQPNNPFRWKHWAIATEKNTQNWADYPCLGLDQDRIYITANMFRGDERSEEVGEEFQRSKCWIIPKSQLRANTGSLKPFVFALPRNSEFTVQPVQVFQSVKEYYLVSIAKSSNKHFNQLKLFKITFSGGKPTPKSIGTVDIHPFPQYPSASYYLQTPDAVQKGSKNKISTNDARLLNAVYRNGSIYAVHHVTSNDGKRTEIAWYQIDPKKKKVVQQGRIKHPSRFYYYPSIAVNHKGDVVVGFNASSPKQYVSAYFTGRRTTDPAGTMRPLTLLKMGQSAFNGDRWGDYSATVVDAPDDTRFWTIQEYALKKKIFGTWWGNITFG